VKLVFAIVQDHEAADVIDALVMNEYRSTRISTVGGFLKRGNATLLVGTDDDQVENVLRLIRENTGHRADAGPRPGGVGTVFVLDVARFVQM